MEYAPKNTSCQSASSDDKFVERIFAEKSQKDSSEKLLDVFLKEGHESQRIAVATSLIGRY